MSFPADSKETSTTLFSVKANYDIVMLAFGALLAAPSIISIIQRRFDITLNLGFGECIAFYRQMFAPFIDAIYFPVGAIAALVHIEFTPPPFLGDLLTISFILAGIFVRAEWTYRASLAAIRPIQRRRRIVEFFEALWLTLWSGITGLAILMWAVGSLIMIATLGQQLKMAQTEGAYRGKHMGRSFLIANLATLIAILCFYAGNAIVPQIIQIR